MDSNLAAVPYQTLEESEAKAFSERLRQASLALFKDKNSSPTVILESILLAGEYNYLLQYANQQKIDLTNKQTTQKLLQTAQRQLQQVPTLTIQLATPMRAAYQKGLIDWFANYGPPTSRIQFRYRPEIIGGLIIEYNGHLYDYSLRSRINHENLSTVSTAI